MDADSKRILIIDDDPDMHEAIKLVLEPAGYQVTYCATGPEGLEAMRRDPPDLVLLDVMLASPSEGIHLAHEMKIDERLKSIPIVMISAMSEAVERDYAEEVGRDYLSVESFIDKPFEAPTVLKAVQDALAKRAGDDASQAGEADPDAD
jgi:CheY-like chemotaxis protein